MPTILIIEDLQDVRELLVIFLSKRGFLILQAKTGEEGIKLVRQNRPDLVLLDARLPDLDGISVLKKIRELEDKIKVVMLTGLCKEDLKEEALRAGATDFLSKTLGVEEIVRKVTDMVC